MNEYINDLGMTRYRQNVMIPKLGYNEKSISYPNGVVDIMRELYYHGALLVARPDNNALFCTRTQHRRAINNNESADWIALGQYWERIYMNTSMAVQNGMAGNADYKQFAKENAKRAYANAKSLCIRVDKLITEYNKIIRANQGYSRRVTPVRRRRGYW